MKKLLGIAILLAAIALIYMYTKKSLPADKNVLVVGTHPNFQPFEYKENGELKGFEIELVHALAKQLRKEVVFKDMAFDALLIEAQAGRIDMIASALTPTPERSTKVFFTKPYLVNDPLIIITLAGTTSLKSIEDIQGKEVIVNDGYTAESYMKKQQGVQLRSLPTVADAFFALLHGQAYAFVSARSAVQPFFDTYGIEKFDILVLPETDSYALAVPKAFPATFQEVNQAFTALEHNGVLQALKNKWHLNF